MNSNILWKLFPLSIVSCAVTTLPSVRYWYHNQNCFEGYFRKVYEYVVSCQRVDDDTHIFSPFLFGPLSGGLISVWSKGYFILRLGWRNCFILLSRFDVIWHVRCDTTRITTISMFWVNLVGWKEYGLTQMTFH